MRFRQGQFTLNDMLSIDLSGECGRLKKESKVRSQREGSAINKISKLPAPVDPTNACAISIVVQRWISKLRWCHHEATLLHKFLRKNSVQFDPKTLLVPVLEHARTFGSRFDAFPTWFDFIAEILRHHGFERFFVARRDRLLQPAEKRLKIDVLTFLAQLRLGLFSQLCPFRLFFCRRSSASTQRHGQSEQDWHDDFHRAKRLSRLSLEFKIDMLVDRDPERDVKNQCAVGA